MPVYVCCPGTGSTEPWRHGIQVYAHPFDVDATPSTASAPSGTSLLYDWPTGLGRSFADDDADEDNNNNNNTSDDQASQVPRFAPATFHSSNTPQQPSSSRRSLLRPQHPNAPIRKLRHAEIVLVDDVCVAHGRYWLRLRWPGHDNNNNNNNHSNLFAGYIAMGRVADENLEDDTLKEQFFSSADAEDREDEDPAREETSSMPPSEPFQGGSMMCRRTGLAFQSSDALRLLAVYDDGVVPSTALPPFPTEPVFCRICREGLHDDADEEQPAAAQDEDPMASREPSAHGQPRDIDGVEGDQQDDDEPVAVDPMQLERTKGPVQPHPTYSKNEDALQNPMLAPCECAGSMAFVHYMCVEQWRCRSRHPEAANGLNCETCGTAYSLPPPSERPQPQPEQEDWLDAMPPHVMQALRQPHLWWQIGAAVVRRRWLRPLAPVLLSPAVALYCRARRLLKKRGVARRRWACSLCRRRARWKCVRCLRSYYCSRQCQNVSWHIIHKHVCYKPVRFWWSVVVYGALTLVLFPGIFRDPLMYDIGFFLIPASFMIMGVLGGGAASMLKRIAGVDVRGRLMEFAVVAYTLWLSVVSWGLVKGFFGDADACYGTLGGYQVTAESLPSTYVLRALRAILFQPAQTVYLALDRLFLKRTPSPLRSILCTKVSSATMAASSSVLATNETIASVAAPMGCFEHLPHANADFMLHEEGGSKCAADLMLVTLLYVVAAATFAGSTLLKQRERHRRHHQRQQRAPRVLRGPHLHQD